MSKVLFHPLFLLAVLHPADQLRVHGDRAERHHDRLQRPRRQGRQRGKQAQSKVTNKMTGCVISLLTQPLNLQAVEAAAAQHHGDLDAGDGGARLPRLPQRQGIPTHDIRKIWLFGPLYKLAKFPYLISILIGLPPPAVHPLRRGHHM